jgi:hypothetical protein
MIDPDGFLDRSEAGKRSVTDERPGQTKKSRYGDGNRQVMLMYVDAANVFPSSRAGTK